MPSACALPQLSLKHLARQKGLDFGSAFGKEELSDPAAVELVLRECNVITVRNALKWKALRPTSEEWSFYEADEIAAFATSHDLQMRGHVLVWDPAENMPDWALAQPGPAEGKSSAVDLLETHIETVCKHYGKQISSWDVVNEAFNSYSGEMNPGFFRDRIGPDYLELAFRKAREAAPHVQLVYNDYMRWSDRYPNHHLTVLRLLEDFKKRDIPIDALGLQSHVGKYRGTENEMHWRRFLEDVTAMGYDLLITELDVRDFHPSSDQATRDADVAALTKGYLDITLSFPEVKQLICWGLSDRWSWFRESEPREDGGLQRTAPFDIDLNPKPMYDAIAAALKGAPVRVPVA